MSVIYSNALFLFLHVLGAHLQDAYKTGMLLSFSLNNHNGASTDIIFSIVLRVLVGGVGIRQASAWGCEAGDHQCRTGEDESDCAAVDPYAGEALRVLVDEPQMRSQRVVEFLEEERLSGEGVERDALLSSGGDMVSVKPRSK
jgi:hypothetical protein